MATTVNLPEGDVEECSPPYNLDQNAEFSTLTQFSAVEYVLKFLYNAIGGASHRFVLGKITRRFSSGEKVLTIPVMLGTGSWWTWNSIFSISFSSFCAVGCSSQMTGRGM